MTHEQEFLRGAHIQHLHGVGGADPFRVRLARGEIQPRLVCFSLTSAGGASPADEIGGANRHASTVATAAMRRVDVMVRCSRSCPRPTSAPGNRSWPSIGRPAAGCDKPQIVSRSGATLPVAPRPRATSMRSPSSTSPRSGPWRPVRGTRAPPRLVHQSRS